MRIEKIAYEQLYPTGVYANQRYRVEVTLDENDSGYNSDRTYISQEDAAKKAFEYAKDIVEKTFLDLNPQIIFSQTKEFGIISPISEPPTTQIEKPIRDTVDNIIEDINSCKELKILETYKLIAKKDERIQSAYNEKFSQLSSLK